MSAIKIIQSFAKKSLTKNQGSGITTLPSQFMAEEKAGQIAALLQRVGIPINQLDDYIRSEKDLIKYLNIIDAANKPTVYSGQAATDQLNKLFPKKGEVFDMSGKKLDAGKPIIGGTQDDTVSGIMTQVDERMTGINKANKKLGELLEEREIMYGKAPKTKKNKKVIEREMFSEANERFNKTDVVADTITKLWSMEPVAALKEANKIIGRQGIYKNLTKDQSQKILKDTDDWIFQRDVADRWDYKKNRPYRDDPNFDPDDPSYDPDEGLDYATGGRAGFYTGGMIDVEPNLSDIGHGSDSLMARTRLVSPGAQATTSTGLNYLLAEDNDNIRVPFKEKGKVSLLDLIKVNASGSKSGKQQIQGAPKGITVDNETINAIINLDIPINEKINILGSYAYGKGRDKIEDKGQEIFLDEGGYKDRNIGLGFNQDGEGLSGSVIRNLETGDDQFNIGFKKSFAEGGRIGLAGGGGRRAFLKLMAALGGGIAGIKTGILGLGGKETGKQVAKEVVKSAGSGGQPPPYFFKLVEKIKTLGDDVTEKAATKDREVVTKYKDFELTEDVATGEQTIQRIKTDTDAMYYDETLAEDVYMNYKPGAGQADEGTKGIPADEYVEDTSYLRTSGPQKGDIYDTVDGVPDDVIQEGTMFEDNMTEFGKTKKADGGRIGFAGGKLAQVSGRKFLEKVFGKEKFKNMIDNDPELEQGMLEVVDMFRKKDKEGLKMYMQKFLPHMDDEMVEDFIIGGEGTEGIAGQLIRLGSGRDYQGKIQMMKEADNVRKLENFNIDGVSKNAEGGRIGKWMGGALSFGKGQLRELLKYMAKGSSHGKTPSEMLQMVNPKQFNKLLNDPTTMGKVTSEAPEGLPRLINEYTSKVKNERADMLGELIGTGRKIKKVDDDLVAYKIKITEDMISKGVDRRTAEEMAETLSKMVADQSGLSQRAVPKVTDRGLLEMENIQKNLITKGRKLQATGGLTTMLGE